MNCNWKSKRNFYCKSISKRFDCHKAIIQVHTSLQAEVTVAVDGLGNQAKGLQAHLVRQKRPALSVSTLWQSLSQSDKVEWYNIIIIDFSRSCMNPKLTSFFGLDGRGRVCQNYTQMLD